MSTVAHQARRGYRTIRLPIAEVDYERFMSEGEFAQAWLDQCSGQHPELFPEAWGEGYVFYGYTDTSRKQHLRGRRVRLRASGEVYSLAAGFVMPYLSGRVTEVEKALFLMRFFVPCWAIAEVFGRDAMYWYRLQQGLGRLSVVGTTVKTPECLPQDLVADEKHSRLDGEKIYIATTAAEGCLLGASAAIRPRKRACGAPMGCLRRKPERSNRPMRPRRSIPTVGRRRRPRSRRCFPRSRSSCAFCMRF